LLLAGCVAALVFWSGDGAATAYGVVPAVVYAAHTLPGRVERRGMIPLGLATVVLLVHLVAFAAGGDGWPGAVAAAIGIAVVDRAFEVVAWLVRPRG